LSEETLQRFLQRLEDDPEFAEKMQDDWEDALDELGLSQTELVAIATQDEDALRRLSGAEVSGYRKGALVQGVYFRTMGCLGETMVQFCRPEPFTMGQACMRR
jgi:hypothetical protein